MYLLADTNPVVIVIAVVVIIVALVLLAVLGQFIGLYIRSYVSGAKVSMVELIGMKLRKFDMNLIVNACQAIGDCTDGREGLIRIRSSQEGDRVRIDVSDNGPGMDEATRLRVFEPFFTTKDVGSGTGLGLSIVFGIVRDHKGSVEVASTPGVMPCSGWPGVCECSVRKRRNSSIDSS